MKSALKKMLFVFILLMWSLHGTGPAYAAHVRVDPYLTDEWDALDAARAYRKDWEQRSLENMKTHEDLIKNYKEKTLNILTGYNGNLANMTPQQAFPEIARRFKNALGSGKPLREKEATLGLQEALNEYMAGQLAIGNDLYIKGLRVRFPSTGDPADPDQQTLLAMAAQELQKGIDKVVEYVRTSPYSMRSGGTVNPQFPFFVENTTATSGTTGEEVHNELYRFTDLVDTAGNANNALAKRMFFFGNVKDVDNFPYWNFPGPEDQDFNNNGIEDAAGREDAAQRFKQSGHATYLHTAMLAAVQREDEFDQNNGYKLKRQILDAQRVFDDILAGFNPLQLLGDFVPQQPVEHFLNQARKVVNDAINAENLAKNAARLYDQDKTQLQSTLETQRISYLQKIEELTFLKNIQDNYDLTRREGREQLFADANKNIEEGKGQMGLQKLAIDDASTAVYQAIKAMSNIIERIRIEEDRNKQIALLIEENGKTFAAMARAETWHSSFSSLAAQFGSPSMFVSALFLMKDIKTHMDRRGELELLKASQQADIGNINSAATVAQLNLDLTSAAISLNRAMNMLRQEEAKLKELWAVLERTVRNYVVARADLAEAYFVNPAYRLDRDKLVEDAETYFESAMIECYYAAKALEYLWAEKFNNPVNRLGKLPEALAPVYDPYVRAESIFSVKFAGTKIPNLDGFLDALSAWDLKMRQLRSPNAQESVVTISIRKDVLGFEGGDDEAYNHLLFKDFIAKHRVDGENVDNPDLLFPFTLELGDEKIFPNHPNIKITQISINLVSSPVKSIAGSGTTSNPVKVDLIMLKEAFVRTFFADYPTDDDILIYGLEEGRNLEKFPFNATVDATIDGWSNPLPIPNIQLADHSPSVSRWMLRMDMNRGNNRSLILENLYDIEITIKYHFGKPRHVAFP